MIDQDRVVTLESFAAFLGCTPKRLYSRLYADRARPPDQRQLPEPLPGKPLRWSPVVIEAYRRGEWKPGKAVR